MMEKDGMSVYAGYYLHLVPELERRFREGRTPSQIQWDLVRDGLHFDDVPDHSTIAYILRRNGHYVPRIKRGKLRQSGNA